MTEFLKTVAKHYFCQLPVKEDGTPNILQLTDYIFVFPNRRAGLFFGQYLVELNQKQPIISPEMITIGDLFSYFSHHATADRTTLLFRLYKVYNEVCKKHDSHYQPEPFDNFIFWGEMMLRDFDDIDRYLVNASEVFCNVSDLKEIEDHFAGYSEEVQKVILGFWNKVSVKKIGEEPAKTSFLQTWAILNDVYTEFRKVLDAEKIAYEGMRKRSVVEGIVKGECEAELGRLPSKIIIVGITAIDEAERQLLKWLQRNERVEFCWDYGDDRLRDERQHASYFFKRNTEEFPNVLTDEEQRAGVVADSDRLMTCIPVPSGVGQTLEASKTLSEWGSKDALHTAVVLADEALLNPMLYSIPEGFEKYNVTMGYSLKTTPASTLFDALIFLQKNLQQDYKTGSYSYYHKAVLPILGHVYMLAFESEIAEALRKTITQKSMHQVQQSLFNELQDSVLAKAIFRPVNTVSDASDYISLIIDVLMTAFGDEDRYALDRETFIAYKNIVAKLKVEIAESGIEALSGMTFLYLLQKLAAGQSVSFSGEPLSGLQIMGVLETRALDFRRIVFLSMNEGTVPAKPSQNSFIPNTLRNAFGLPTQKHRDAIFAYHFYRLLSRAEEVCFIYDNRTEGMSTGEPSRYLLQLQYLAAEGDEDLLKLKVPSLSVSTEEPEKVEVIKTERVMKMLDCFRVGGNRNITASNLKAYSGCKLQFFLSHVMGLYLDDELEDEIASSTFGSILHSSMQEFYKPFVGKVVLADKLRDYRNDKDRLRKIISDSFSKVYHKQPVSGYDRLICELILDSIEAILDHDLKLTPFDYLSSEASIKTVYKVNDGLSVNIKYIIDRIDIFADPSHLRHLRVVDYKTGSPSNKLTLKSFGDIFSNNKDCSKEAFQVLFYCYMLSKALPEELQQLNLYPQTAINNFNCMEPHLYFTRSILNNQNEAVTIVDYNKSKHSTESFDNQEIQDFSIFASAFGDALNRVLEEIFDPNVPFTQTDEAHACQYCHFADLCGRSKS